MPVRSRSVRSRLAIHSRASLARPGAHPAPARTRAESRRPCRAAPAARRRSPRSSRAEHLRADRERPAPGHAVRPVSADVRQGSAAQSRSVARSRGVGDAGDRPVDQPLDIADRARAPVASSARARASPVKPATPSWRSRSASRSSSGCPIQRRSRRAPIGVRVWSSTAIRLCRFSPRALSVSSRLRRVCASSVMKPSTA